MAKIPNPVRFRIFEIIMTSHTPSTDQIVSGIIKYLSDIDQIARLPEIISALQKHIPTITKVRVESAIALSEDEKETLMAWIKTHLEQSHADFMVNPDLVGGLKIWLGDQVLDLSVQAKLGGLYV